MLTLTERSCDRIKPRQRKFEIACSGLRGFILRVLPSGKKAYYVRHVVGGRDKRTRIGSTTDISFANARRRALEILAEDAASSSLPQAPL